MHPGARRAVILFGAALGVRMVAAAVLGIDGPPVEDERGYLAIARSLAAGDGFALELPAPLDELAPPRSAFRAPLLPLFLCPLAALGADALAMRCVSILLGACGAPLLDAALCAGGRPRTGWLAGLAYALWPPAMYLSLRVLSEPLSQALLLGAVAMIVSGRRPIVAGTLASLSVLARPAALVPAALLALAAGDRRRGMLFGAAFVAVLAPWLVRNAALHGRPLITTNTGVTLVGGNSSAALLGTPPGKWQPPRLVYAEADERPDLGMWGWSGLGEEASDRRFTCDAFVWLGDHPGDAAALSAAKLWRLFHPDPRSRKSDARLKQLLGYASLGPVLLLLLPGLAAMRRRREGWAPWLLLIGGTVGTAIVFYGDTRMRTAADPALLAVAAAGLLAVLGRPEANQPGTGSGSMERDGGSTETK